MRDPDTQVPPENRVIKTNEPQTPLPEEDMASSKDRGPHCGQTVYIFTGRKKAETGEMSFRKNGFSLP